MAWSQTHDTPQHNYGADGPFSFCSYPFLLNPRAKSKLLHTEARYIMTQVQCLLSLAGTHQLTCEWTATAGSCMKGTCHQMSHMSFAIVRACSQDSHNLVVPAACGTGWRNLASERRPACRKPCDTSLS